MILREMEGDFDHMPRPIFVGERSRKKYFGEDEEDSQKKED